MPSWRSDRRRALTGAAAAILLLMPMAASAQQAGPPLRLLPSPPGAAPAPAAPEPLPSPPPSPAAATDESIRATPLAPVDASWIGTLEPSAHPLDRTLWQGTPRAFVAAALPQLMPTTSPTLQDLSRRLLLSNAVAPEGEDASDRPSLAALRLERLVALGEVDGALGVLAALPATMRGEELERQRVQLAFANNDVASACSHVQDSIARYQGVWWDRALVACQALGGDQAKAVLGLSLLREQDAPPDATFDALIAAMGGRAIKLDKLGQPTPMLASLVAAAKLTAPRDPIGAADATTLRGWAMNEAVPPIQRLAAAERAAALGALAPAALGELYAKVEFRPDELGAAIKQAKAPANQRDRALLYQVARTDPATAARAAALKALLADARTRGDFITMARVVAPLLTELPPGDELAPFAPEALRALYAAGRTDAATPWLAFDRSQRPLLPLLGLIGLPGPVNRIEAPLPAAQQALHLALLAALDRPVGAGDWAPLIAAAHEGTLPNAALWLDQQQAASAKRVGETVLATLILARAGDQLATEPIVLARAVAGLKAVGLESDARALAIEAALDAGL